MNQIMKQDWITNNPGAKPTSKPKSTSLYTPKDAKYEQAVQAHKLAAIAARKAAAAAAKAEARGKFHKKAKSKAKTNKKRGKVYKKSFRKKKL